MLEKYLRLVRSFEKNATDDEFRKELSNTVVSDLYGE